MNVSGLRLGPVSAFLIGAGVVGLIALIGLAVSPESRAVPALFLLIPVLLTAIVGGRTPSLAVGVLAGLALATAFLPPIGSPAVRFADDVLALIVFLMVAFAVSGLLAVTLDAERRRRAADEARLAALEAVDENRRGLLRAVSHELRTPLGIVHGTATELLDGESIYDSAGRQKLLMLLVDETGRLERIVTNLLAMSRIDARAWRAECELVDVGDLVAAVVRRAAGSPRSPRIDVDVDSDLPAVLADPMQLDLVLSNLIDNGLRHSPPGRPLSVASRREDGCVRISVIDEGAGIDPEIRDHIFEPFVTGAGGQSTGIGLALCKAIVTVHGGTIEVIEARETEGTAAIVRLPPA